MAEQFPLTGGFRCGFDSDWTCRWPFLAGELEAELQEEAKLALEVTPGCSGGVLGCFGTCFFFFFFFFLKLMGGITTAIIFLNMFFCFGLFYIFSFAEFLRCCFFLIFFGVWAHPIETKKRRNNETTNDERFHEAKAEELSGSLGETLQSHGREKTHPTGWP